VRPGVKLLLEGMRPYPSHVVSRTNDLLAHNPSGLRLFAGIEDWPAKDRNVARYVFLHPAARHLFDDWHNQVRGCVARLRALAGTDPDAPGLTRLAGEPLVAHGPGRSHPFVLLMPPRVPSLTRRTTPKSPAGRPGVWPP
jgi:hypothetical protein